MKQSLKKIRDECTTILDFLSFDRVLTSSKERTGIVFNFIYGEPTSVWGKIYKNHMSEESFKSGEEIGAIKSLLETNQLLTAFFTIEAMDYYSKPCELKFVWKSPEKAISSFAFPKGSPLLPFFKHAYSKIRQSGNLERISIKWMKKGKPLNCHSNNSMEPLTLNKTGSLFVLLFMGMVFAIAAFIFEVSKLLFRFCRLCVFPSASASVRPRLSEKTS